MLVLAWRRRDLLLWALWLWLTVLPIVMLDLIRTTQHLEFIRYTLLASPALYAVVAAALSDRPGKVRFLPPLLACIACVLAIQAAYSTWWKADWRLLSDAIDKVARPGDVTVFWRGDAYVAYPSIAFAHSQYYRHGEYGPIVLMQNPPTEAMLRQLRAAPGVLLISLQRGDAIVRCRRGNHLEGLRARSRRALSRRLAGGRSTGGESAFDCAIHTALEPS